MTSNACRDGGTAKSQGKLCMRCPKCRRVQTLGDACRECGLRTALFAEFASNHDPTTGPLGDLFAACESSWHDEDAHERLLEVASAGFSFSQAARFYRDVLGRRPDDAVARRQLERLTRMAEAAFMSPARARTSRSEEPSPYKNVLIMLVVFLLLGAVSVGLNSILKLPLDDRTIQDEELGAPGSAAIHEPTR